MPAEPALAVAVVPASAATATIAIATRVSLFCMYISLFEGFSKNSRSLTF
jgi:hypothetical protein